MNKIEEILEDNLKDVNINGFYGIASLHGTQIDPIKDALKEFGKICFDAGAKLTWKSTGEYFGYESYKYKTYEEFIKEIENETITRCF